MFPVRILESAFTSAARTAEHLLLVTLAQRYMSVKSTCVAIPVSLALIPILTGVSETNMATPVT